MKKGQVLLLTNDRNSVIMRWRAPYLPAKARADGIKVSANSVESITKTNTSVRVALRRWQAGL